MTPSIALIFLLFGAIGLCVAKRRFRLALLCVVLLLVTLGAESHLEAQRYYVPGHHYTLGCGQQGPANC